jgi:hypothetical protein
VTRNAYNFLIPTLFTQVDYSFCPEKTSEKNVSTAQVHDDRVKVTQNNKSLKENIETGKERK